MFTRAKKILASELMYALEMNEDEVEQHIYSLLSDSSATSRNGHKVAVGAK
jgi:CarD family transcriptional regulator